MANHRYWRVDKFEAYNSASLALSALHLLSGTTRVDVPATLTSSLAPTTGALVNLQDSDLSTDAVWLNCVGLKLNWDFGPSGAVDVTDVRLGAAADNNRFPLYLTVSWSDDAITWTTYTTFAGITWPGARTATSSLLREYPGNTVRLHMSMDGVNASTVFPDEMGHAFTAAGGAQLSTTAPKFGTAALSLSGSGAYLSTPDKLLDFAFGTGDFSVECWIKTSATREQVFLDIYAGGSGSSWQMELNSAGRLTWYAGGTSSGAVLTGTSVLYNGVYHHVVFSRVSGTMSAIVNGVVEATVADTRDYSNIGAGVFAIGAQVGTRNSTYDFAGSIDEVRVSKGASMYSGAFTPLAAPLPNVLFSLIAINKVAGRAGYNAAAYANSAGATPPFTSSRAIPVPVNYRARTNYIQGGQGRIYGTTKLDGTPLDTPVSRRVRLIRDRDGMLVRELWSNAITGAYDFQYVEMDQTYTVITYDHTHNFRAVVADNITPELML